MALEGHHMFSLHFESEGHYAGFNSAFNSA